MLTSHNYALQSLNQILFRDVIPLFYQPAPCNLEEISSPAPSKRFWLRHGHHAVVRVATWCIRELDSFSTILE